MADEGLAQFQYIQCLVAHYVAWVIIWLIKSENPIRVQKLNAGRNMLLKINTSGPGNNFDVISKLLQNM